MVTSTPTTVAGSWAQCRSVKCYSICSGNCIRRIHNFLDAIHAEGLAREDTLMTTFCGLSIRRRRAADASFLERCGNAMNNVALFIGRGVDVMRCILHTKLMGMHIQG